MKRTTLLPVLLLTLLGAAVATGSQPAATVPGLAPADYPPPVPAQLLLTIRETAGIARSGEVVRSGVPLPRSLNVRDPATLTLVDGSGSPVPAEFEVLARWDAGLSDGSAPIQWLLVTVAATVPANGSASFRVVTDGSAGANPAPTTPLTLTQSGNRVTVNTGAATFTLGGSASALFDEVRLASGTRLVSGSVLSATVAGAQTTHSSTRRLWVEHAGPLAAVVVVEGAYDLAPVGGGGLGAQRRYLFTAGSPTAIVRHSVAWEGDRCPGNGYDLTCNGQVNGLLVQRVRDSLALDLPAPRALLAVGDREAAALSGSASAGQAAWVRQWLRSSRTAPPTFDVSLPGSSGTTGGEADGAMLAVGGSGGAVAVALQAMHRYEPQALRLLADGSLAVDLADDRAWLGQRQGMFATLAVTALPAMPTRATLDAALWAPLNRPLRAWAAPAWFAASGAVEEFPVGALPASLASYDTIMAGLMATTRQQVAAKGLHGLMTFGLWPRTWGNPLFGDEIDCGDDPTPADDWDDPYWCAAWTDYHNTGSAAPLWAMRSGEVEWLDELAFPAALRMLHTQIMQCAPGDGWFYCGQAPAGYGGYRLDFNSSHAYWDNLFLYYWLTGDRTVVQRVQRGATTMRNYLCSRRPAQPCQPTDPPADFWAFLTGRSTMQWLAAFRFVGLASDDASYLDDYRGGLARAVTQHYVEAAQGGTPYGFWLWGGDPVDGPGTDGTDQLWMATLYDMALLHRLQRDTNDAPIGSPAIPPSQVGRAWARTLVRWGATTAGDGTAAGQWPNALTFTWAGSRVGGTLASVAADTSGGDPFLYASGKATLTGHLVRVGDETGESAIAAMGTDMTALALAAASDDPSPMSKEKGLLLSRLHPAVARLAAAGPALTPSPTPTRTATPGPSQTPTRTATPGPTQTPTRTPTPAPTGEPGVLLHTTLDSAAAIAAPAVGPGGTTTLGAGDFVAGRVGSGAQFVGAGKVASFPAVSGAQQSIESDQGEVEFWYRPAYDAAADDVTHALLVLGDIYNAPRLTLIEGDRLALTLVDGGWNARAAVAPYRAPLWTAGQWVHLRATWDRALAADALQLYVNGRRVDEASAAGGWALGSEAALGALFVGSANGAGDSVADGVLDEIIIRAAPSIPAACPPDSDASGTVDIIDIQRHAISTTCRLYLPQIARTWRAGTMKR